MDNSNAPEWIAFAPARWISGTAEMDGTTEFVFFRLCLIAYEAGRAVIGGSDKRNAMRCKVTTEDFKEALEMLKELEKITVSDAGIEIPSVAKRLQDSNARMMARRRGASISRRRRELKGEGKSDAQINLIIRTEFPDDQSDDQPPIQTDRTEQNSTPPKGGECEGGLFGGETDGQNPPSKAPSFPAFWAIVPAKVKKAEAEKAWKRLAEADRIAAHDKAADFFAHWRKMHPQASWLHPSSYLNGRRWEDEFPGSSPKAGDKEALENLAELIKGPKFCPQNLLSPARRDQLLEGGYVTEDDLRKKGL